MYENECLSRRMRTLRTMLVTVKMKVVMARASCRENNVLIDKSFQRRLIFFKGQQICKVASSKLHCHRCAGLCKE